MQQLFYIEGRLLGTAPRGVLSHSNGLSGLPLSKLFFCNCCGEVFARCPLVKADGSCVPWQAVYAVCRKCTPKQDLLTAGSIWHHETEFTDAFPDAVLQWELQRHLDHFEGIKT